MTIEDRSPISCPICGAPMRLIVTTNKNGKHAIGVFCPQDGRHFRGFINHRPYVDQVIDQVLWAGTGDHSPKASAPAAPSADSRP